MPMSTGMSAQALVTKLMAASSQEVSLCQGKKRVMLAVRTTAPLV